MADALVQAVLDEAAGAGLRRVVLEVADGNERAIGSTSGSGSPARDAPASCRTSPA